MNEMSKPYTILFVEDEDAIRKNYVQYLKMFYKDVYEADNGECGYKMYRDKKPNIIILDINLPKMSGLEMLSKIRENDYSTKVIMLTAHSNVEFLLEASQLKLTKYLVKPISKDELDSALSLAIDELNKFEILSKKIVTLKNNCMWRYDTNDLICNDYVVKLTEKERNILELFFQNPNKVFSYDDIIYEAWDDPQSDLDTIKAAIKTAMKNLRKKLPENTIVNIYGVGYKIEVT